MDHYSLLYYASDMHLIQGDRLVKSNIADHDTWLSEEDFLAYAAQLATVNNESELSIEKLPKILGEKCKPKDIIKLAKRLGMLKTRYSIFSALENASVIRLDKKQICTSINDGYLLDVEGAFVAGLDPMNVIVWEAEAQDGTYYEFKLSDLADAVVLNDGMHWNVQCGVNIVELAVL